MTAGMRGAVGESGLRDFVKRRQVHYSVEPEWVITDAGRWPVGFSVRLFAAHDRRAGALPSGPRSRALATSLRSLAESVLPDCGSIARVELEPFRPALYESSGTPGTDEVELAIQVLREFEPHVRPAGAPEESCLKEIRKRFKRLSVPER